jgi:hypothetical protein
VISPLDAWFASERTLDRFRRTWLGRAPVVLRPRNPAWRGIVPGFEDVVRLVGRGVPFHVVAERHYDRAGEARRLAAALASGATVYVPQAHQVLPRLARLMVAVRTAIVAGARAECSFLFLVEGRGRAGMGLHHDGPVHGFWLQVAGRRTVTIGPPVRPGTAQDLDDGLTRGPGWQTLQLDPGTLFHLPPYTPHAVVCRRRSLAVSMTWSARQPRGAPGLAGWDVAAGQAVPRPRASRTRLWTQVPVAVSTAPRKGSFTLQTPEGRIRLPAAAYPLARRLALMPSLTRAERGTSAEGLVALLEAGLVGPEDLPLTIVPARPRALDGWRFA